MRKYPNFTHAQKISNRIDQLLMEDVCFTSQGLNTQTSKFKDTSNRNLSNNSSLKTYQGITSKLNLKRNNSIQTNPKVHKIPLSEDRRITPSSTRNQKDNQNFYEYRLNNASQLLVPSNSKIQGKNLNKTSSHLQQKGNNFLDVHFTNKKLNNKQFNSKKQFSNERINLEQLLGQRQNDYQNQLEQQQSFIENYNQNNLQIKKSCSSISSNLAKSSKTLRKDPFENNNQKYPNKFLKPNKNNYKTKQSLDIQPQQHNQYSPTLLLTKDSLTQDKFKPQKHVKADKNKKRQRNQTNFYRQQTLQDQIKQSDQDQLNKIDIDDYMISRGFSSKKWISKNFNINQTHKAPYLYPLSPQNNEQQNQNPQKNSFNISHEQLQFLTLLYPNQSPQLLMIKLLNYYEQQQKYRNSLNDLVNQNHHKKLKQSELNQKFYENQNTNHKNKLNQFLKLEEECLAALGSQMVETQIKKSEVQTANVNYYTRQYAMPQILQLVKEKNQQAREKLEQYTQNVIKASTAPINTSFFNSNTIFRSSIALQQSFTHKVYIPANMRGQCFDMEYRPDSKLFEYLPQNDYRRILRDINHLIQKVLSYHRHNSFLKKKKNYLLQGWNLALLLSVIFTFIFLYVQSTVIKQKTSIEYMQVLAFFCVAFIFILILGNAFNNYKKDVKRSSLIKDICQQISNYFQFINCSSKKVKWILGKDFFWIEIWINIKTKT